MFLTFLTAIIGLTFYVHLNKVSKFLESKAKILDNKQ